MCSLVEFHCKSTSSHRERLQYYDSDFTGIKKSVGDLKTRRLLHLPIESILRYDSLQAWLSLLCTWLSQNKAIMLAGLTILSQQSSHEARTRVRILPS